MPGIAARREHELIGVRTVAAPARHGLDGFEHAAACDPVPTAKPFQKLSGAGRQCFSDMPIGKHFRFDQKNPQGPIELLQLNPGSGAGRSASQNDDVVEWRPHRHRHEVGASGTANWDPFLPWMIKRSDAHAVTIARSPELVTDVGDHGSDPK